MLPRAHAVELEITWLVGKPEQGIRNAPVICFVHVDDSVGEGGEGGAVGDEDDRAVGGEAADGL
ncbi:hypothetical protein AB0L25_41025, partial [Spirillospora sp. NPDC052242]